MTASVPNQAYIDSLLETIQTEGLTHERLCQLLFAVIDQFCAQVAPRSGPGRHKTYSDSTILKLDMLMHLTGKRGETEILREVERHYRAYFDRLPDQSRLWHRIRAALPLIERFRRHLRACLGVAYEDIRILDTLPIPVADRHARPGRGNGFQRADGAIVPARSSSIMASSWACSSPRKASRTSMSCSRRDHMMFTPSLTYSVRPTMS